ncbi:MAG TPA: helix-turn-helix domain-containing protein [Bacteroidales bacterium]|nr:helix-turn-helix domain-containing protein [Bacteroidales bacterium]
MEKITFDNLPDAVQELHKKIDRLLNQTQAAKQSDPDKLLTLEELIEFLPEKPAKQTIYGWVNGRLIPYEKHGKRLYFRKSEVDMWLSNGRQV